MAIATPSAWWRGHTAIAILGIVGVVTLLWATPRGIGIGPDSLVYIDAAESLLNGQGYVEHTASGDRLPLIHFPPGYPLLLAIAKSFGFSILSGARSLNALLFGLNILLVGITVFRATGGAYGPATMGSLLMLTSPNMLSSHAWAFTEGAFLLFGLLGVVLLAAYVENPTPLRFAGAVVSVSLAFLTRYMGVAFVAAGSLGLLALPAGRDLRRRWGDALLFGALSSLPMALFVLRNRVVRGGVADFQLGFHGLTSNQLWDGVNTISCWLLPEAVPVIPRVIFCALVAGIAVVGTVATGRRARGHVHRESVLPVFLIILVVVYILALLGFIVFVASDIVFDSRYLVPAQEVTFVLVLWLGHKWFSLVGERRLYRIGTVLLCAAVVAAYAARSTRYALRIQRGLGYANADLAASPIFRTVRALPPRMTVYSNRPSAVHYYTGRPVLAIPARSDPHSGSINPLFEDKMTSLKILLEKDRAAIVYLKHGGAGHMPSEQELTSRLPVRLVETSAEGSIYEGSVEK